MALSIQERRALLFARTLIATGRQVYICLALTEVAESRPQLTAAAIRLKTYINGKLGSWPALGPWQMARGMDRSAQQQRLDRMEWIDWMLGD